MQMFERIRQILEFARSTVARSVNSTQVVANWLIGREIVEEEQKGCAKAGYGTRLLADLSGRLQEEYGNGYSVDNLEYFCAVNFRRTASEIASTRSRRWFPVNWLRVA